MLVKNFQSGLGSPRTKQLDCITAYWTLDVRELRFENFSDEWHRRFLHSQESLHAASGLPASQSMSTTSYNHVECKVVLGRYRTFPHGPESLRHIELSRRVHRTSFKPSSADMDDETQAVSSQTERRADQYGSQGVFVVNIANAFLDGFTQVSVQGISAISVGQRPPKPTT